MYTNSAPAEFQSNLVSKHERISLETCLAVQIHELTAISA